MKDRQIKVAADVQFTLFPTVWKFIGRRYQIYSDWIITITGIFHLCYDLSNERIGEDFIDNRIAVLVWIHHVIDTVFFSHFNIR